MKKSLTLSATVSGAYAQLLGEWLKSVRSPDVKLLTELAQLTRYAPTLENALDDYLRFEGLQYGATWGRLIELPNGIGLRWFRTDILDPLIEIVGWHPSLPMSVSTTQRIM